MKIERAKNLWPQNCAYESDDVDMVENHCRKMLDMLIADFRAQYKRQNDVKYKIKMSIEKMTD